MYEVITQVTLLKLRISNAAWPFIGSLHTLESLLHIQIAFSPTSLLSKKPKSMA